MKKTFTDFGSLLMMNLVVCWWCLLTPLVVEMVAEFDTERPVGVTDSRLDQPLRRDA
jgi:hypothetical protein